MAETTNNSPTATGATSDVSSDSSLTDKTAAGELAQLPDQLNVSDDNVSHEVSLNSDSKPEANPGDKTNERNSNDLELKNIEATNDEIQDNEAVGKEETTNPSPDEPKQIVMGIPLALLFACGGGITVANLYLAQPILYKFKQEYGITDSEAGSVVSLEQAGYAVGLLFLTPLGDLLPRKPLMLILTLITTVFNLAKGLAVNFAMLQAFSFLLGFATVTPQILMPFAADLAPANRRGFLMGLVLTGMKIGSLMGRLISGIVAQYFSWRVPFLGQAVLNFLLVILFAVFLPKTPRNNTGITYPKLLYSMLVLAKTQPALLQSSFISLFIFAIFSAYWTCQTFLLSSPPYNYPTSTIGLMSLVGIFGMLFATSAGALADRVGPMRLIGIGIACTVAVWVFLTPTATLGIWAVILGSFLQEVSMQLIHLPNQVRVFGLVPKARSRLNSIYMIVGFIGMSVGSVIGVQAWVHGGWTGVGLTCLGFACVAMCIWLLLDADGNLRRCGKKPIKAKDTEAQSSNGESRDEEVDLEDKVGTKEITTETPDVAIASKA